MSVLNLLKEGGSFSIDLSESGIVLVVGAGAGDVQMRSRVATTNTAGADITLLLLKR